MKLVLILIFAFLLRFIFIGEVPPGPAYDEIQVLINAKSLTLTGQTTPGTVTGIFGPAIGNYDSGVFSELGSYLTAFWIYLFNFNWPLIKVPFIFISLGMITFVYLITKKLINEKCALIAALLFSINPWSIHLGRTTYESLFSYLFYLIAIYGFISFQGKKILLTIPFLILGFLTYFGAKPQLPALLIVGIVINYLYFPKNIRKNAIYLGVVAIAITLLFILYSITFLNNPSSLRLKETQSKQSYSEIVDAKRRMSISSPLNFLAENKLIEEFNERTSSYLGGLSPNFLFLEGPTGGTETLIITDNGPMYLIDGFLIILGIIFLSRKYPRALITIILLIGVALIPNSVRLNLNQYILRDGLLFPLLTILSAGGIYFIFKTPFIYLTAFLYIFSFLIFLNNYFYLTPIDKSEGWNLQNRILSKYLTLAKESFPDQKFFVTTKEINGVSAIYLLFSKNYETRDQILKVNSNLAKYKHSFPSDKEASESYQLGNVKFLVNCPTEKFASDRTFLLDPRIDCKIPEQKQSVIASPKDAGGKYYIYNDKLCSGGKKAYPLVKNIFDLNIEKMSKDEFCEKWITNP